MVSPIALAMSSPPQAPQAGVQPADVLGAYNLSANMANNQYLAKLQQQNALWGGLAGLGGAGLEGYLLKGGLFGAGTPAATAAPSVGLTGNAITDASGASLAGAGAPGWAGSILPADLGLTGATGSAADLAGTLGTGAAADSAFGAGASAIPFLGSDAVAAGAPVAADLAAAAPATIGATDAAVTGAFSLADLLPFLFA